MRIDAHQLAVVIGVAVAGSRRARLDVAHHRTGIAADLVTCCSSRISQHEQALEAGVKLSNIARSVAMLRGAASDLGESRIVRDGPVRSYTNDVARTAKTCQASDEAKPFLP